MRYTMFTFIPYTRYVMFMNFPHFSIRTRTIFHVKGNREKTTTLGARFGRPWQNAWNADYVKGSWTSVRCCSYRGSWTRAASRYVVQAMWSRNMVTWRWRCHLKSLACRSCVAFIFSYIAFFITQLTLRDMCHVRGAQCSMIRRIFEPNAIIVPCVFKKPLRTDPWC